MTLLRFMEAKTGLPLAQLAEDNRGHRVSFADIVAKPTRLINSPMWSGLTQNGRPYSPFTYNVEQGVPWRTLTGRQHFYLDHPGYIDFGEHLPTYKPKPPFTEYGDLRSSQADAKTIMHVEDLIDVQRQLGFRYEIPDNAAEHYQWICPPCRRAAFVMAQSGLWRGRRGGATLPTEGGLPPMPAPVNNGLGEGPLGEEDAENFHP